MATLGELERSVMDLLWDSAEALTAGDIRDGLSRENAAGAGKDLAVTTVLTVLSRLEAKDFVTRDRDTRPHLFRASTSRAAHMAELMHEVLGAAPDREAVLARFVGQVGAGEAATLRRMLDGK
ncbi:BlaI/MecI/CopY family transcriptional regulator [Glaciihabitans sp. UYNi722]|uniref:BlaI/MecI/CopY family transcriptional regulator n=1 Tax=Glaciihabitans sp. UYNi722 TaxID=3156344 RepID=UPI0033934216